MNSDKVYAKLMCEGTPTNRKSWMLSSARRAANFALNRFNKFHSNIPKTNLDIGCGVGEFTRFLEKNEFNCFGIDINEEFIDKAQKFSSNNIYIKGNFLDHKIESKYGLISATHEVFNMIFDYKALIKKVDSLLVDGGFFIFDFITERGFETWQDVQIQERNDFLMIQKCIYNKEQKKGTVKLTGFVLDENKQSYDRFDVISDVFNHNLHEVIDYIKFLGLKVEMFAEWEDATQIGFENLDNPNINHSTSLFIVCFK